MNTSGVGYTAFKSGFEISPILLTGGIADLGVPIPIVTFTEPMNTVMLLASGKDPGNLDNFFAHFFPIPGSTLQNNQFGKYPFANQAIAANAMITQPLTVSLLMVCPVKTQGGYVSKLATFLALKQLLDKHNASGGTYTVLTPTAVYTHCLLAGLTDVSEGQSKQTQIQWQWDFEQPLLTLGLAQAAMNNTMGKISQGTPIAPVPVTT